jgi:predicted transcriptional regulator
MSGILDYCKVSVKPGFLQNFGVPGIEHYEAIRKELVRLLRKERERKKLSNYAVSQRSGVSESMLSLIERGLRNPTVELMLRIADGIGANLPALIEKATTTVVRQARGKSVMRKEPSRSGT